VGIDYLKAQEKQNAIEPNKTHVKHSTQTKNSSSDESKYLTTKDEKQNVGPNPLEPLLQPVAD
jgi:hypothetical protein